MSEPKLPQSLVLAENIENKQMRIETVSIFPRTINDNSESGGVASFILPNKNGYLSADSRIVLPAVSVNKAYQYPPNVGVFSLIETATLRTSSSGALAQVSNAGHIYADLNQMRDPEMKRNIDSQIHGINFVFETCSGSKMDSNPNSTEVLPGQYRLVMDEYKSENPSHRVKGRENCIPNMMDGEQNLVLGTSYDDTPEYSISLGDLFPGLFKIDRQFPLPLISEEVTIDLVFSKNGDWGNNDRAIYCPKLSTHDKSSIISVSWIRQGISKTANQTDQILSNPKSYPDGKEEDTGSNLRLLYDTDSEGKMINIRVLDGGNGFSKDKAFAFGNTEVFDTIPVFIPSVTVKEAFNNAGNSLIRKFDTHSSSGYEDGKVYNVKYSDNQSVLCNEKNSFTVKYHVPADTTESPYWTFEDKENTYIPSGPFKVEKISGNPTQDTLLFAKKIIDVTCTDNGENWSVNDPLVVTTVSPDDIQAYVFSVDEDDIPDQIAFTGYYEPEKDDTITLETDETKGVEIESVGNTTTLVNFYGVGYDPVFNYDDSQGRKINIKTDQVLIATDLIYYLDGKLERDREKMMNKGLSWVYTQFKSMKSTISEFSDDISQYGETKNYSFSRLMGLSNEVLRNILFKLYPSGAHKLEKFPYSGYKNGKQNPLLLNYVSRASRVKDGMKFNVNVNSIPYYSSQIQTDLRMYQELNKLFGKVFYINKGHYMGYPDCRQDKQTSNLDENDPSEQPGFTTLDSNDKITLQYQENDRKAGIANQGYYSINQGLMRGMGHLNGVSFKKETETEQVMGNGIMIGSQAVDLQFEYGATYDPRFQGQATLMVFAEVERALVLSNGEIQTTTASM